MNSNQLLHVKREERFVLLPVLNFDFGCTIQNKEKIQIVP